MTRKPVAIIPARGGSKRIKRKNVREFLGIPILGRVLTQLNDSGLFAELIVSTDDREIADLSRNFGASLIIERPADLSDDFTGVKPVIQHAMNHQNTGALDFDEVLCIFPTSVFISTKMLLESYDLFQTNPNCAGVVSVLEYPHPIERSLKINNENHISFNFPEFAHRRTQDLDKNYFDAAQFYWAKKNSWLSEDSILELSIPYELKKWDAVDIDNEDDWILAERLFRAANR